jgi:serine/threonine protein kinase
MPDERAKSSVARSRHDLDPHARGESGFQTVASDSAGLPKPGEVVADKYAIECLLGRGGMGAVFEAVHVLSGKRVAVKWMLPGVRQARMADRFMHEARATARIDHPNVVDIYDVGTKGDSAFLVMELLHGESLARRLECASLTPTEAVALLMPALRGVAAAHARGVIHRDLKPENIFLCTGPDGEWRDCKVLDFGISKVEPDQQRDIAMTHSGIVMGTPYYMSPEQIRGLNQVDERGDVYALGVILYEMLTGAHPFDANTYNALIVKIATSEPTSIETLKPGIDRGLVAVVMKAIAREREERFQSVAELGLALEPFAAGVSFLPHPRAVRPRAMKPLRQSRMSPLSLRLRLVLALAALLMPCAAGLGWHWVRSPAASNSAEAEPIPHEFVARPRSSADHSGTSSALPTRETAPSGPADEALAPAIAPAARPRSLHARARRPAEVATSPKPGAAWDERIEIKLPESAASPVPARGTPRKDTASAAGRLTAGDL